MGLITSVIVAQILQPEGRGLYAVTMAITAAGVQFDNFGLNKSNTYHTAKEQKLLPKLTSNTLFMSFGVGYVGVFFAWVIFSLYPSQSPVHGALLGLALVGIPFGLATVVL